MAVDGAALLVNRNSFERNAEKPRRDDTARPVRFCSIEHLFFAFRETSSYQWIILDIKNYKPVILHYHNHHFEFTFLPKRRKISLLSASFLLLILIDLIEYVMWARATTTLDSSWTNISIACVLSTLFFRQCSRLAGFVGCFMFDDMPWLFLLQHKTATWELDLFAFWFQSNFRETAGALCNQKMTVWSPCLS